MSKKPIIIISGEPYSIFFEILFKIYKSNYLKNYKYPIIIIGSKKIMKNQMRLMKYNIEINLINKDKILSGKIFKKKINLINVDTKLKKTFSKITSKSNE